MPSVDFPFLNSKIMSTTAKLGPIPAKAAAPPEQKQAGLREITEAWLNQMDGSQGPDYRKVENLKQKVVTHVQERMDMNATAREQKPREYMAQDRQQQNFWLDETVALELEIFFKDKGQKVGSCAQFMNQAILGIDSEHRTQPKQKRGTRSAPNLINGESGLASPGHTASTENDACRELVMALVRAFPQLAFEPACPLNDHYHREMRESAFTAMIGAGPLRLVKYMIDKFLDSSPQGKSDHQETMQNPRTRLVERLISEPDPRSSLRQAMYLYRTTKAKSYLAILEELLKLDDGQREDGRLMDEHTLSGAIKLVEPRLLDSNPSLDIVEMILKYRSDLRTITTLGLALKRNNLKLAELFFTGAKINQEIAKEIIELGLEDVWVLPSTQKAVADLLGDGEIARELFRWALNQLDQSRPAKDQTDRSSSSKDQPDPSNVEKHQPKGSRFLEDILRMIGSFDSDVRAEIVKSGKLWFWELQSVQRLWKKEKAQNPDMWMLHVAVQHQQVEMVKHFLDVEPDSVLEPMEVPTLKRKDKKVYALWHNNYLVPRDESPSSDPDRRQAMKKASSDSILVTKPIPANGEPDRGLEAALASNPSLSANANSKSENSPSADSREQIRKLLVPAVIERASGMNSLAKIFRESGGEFETAKMKPCIVLLLWDLS
jgi:hypothetical protein